MVVADTAGSHLAEAREEGAQHRAVRSAIGRESSGHETRTGQRLGLRPDRYVAEASVATCESWLPTEWPRLAGGRGTCLGISVYARAVAWAVTDGVRCPAMRRTDGLTHTSDVQRMRVERHDMIASHTTQGTTRQTLVTFAQVEYLLYS